MRPMRFRVLGPVAVHEGPHPISLCGGKQAALLAVLLSRANTVLPRNTLIDALWAPEPPPSAADMLRWHVHKLRKALGEERLTTAPSGYALTAAPDEIDAQRFETTYAHARHLLAQGDPVRAGAALQDALSLWYGPAAYGDVDNPMVHTEATRLHELRLAACEQLAHADLATGQDTSAVARLRPLVAENPFQERFRAQLMLALCRSGRRAEALDVFHDGRRLLDEELGLRPCPELLRLQHSILIGETEQAAT
ncbi:AfsR/SARP family transcriptional regulator [Streptomyces spiramyceticus]|uniref:AfsR/SARP family transcriptional regulator n=1 Tax=Streptomyces spiramyceticus TaxID=299717 RepID=UPI00237AC8F3|nr:BTAD domain-containing putative transcriptional regulator [Streptomyces spiramyceticus]